MMPQQLGKFLWKVDGLDKSHLPVLPGKVKKIAELAQSADKIVVLCSYITTVKTIAKHLTINKVKVFELTGRIFDKNAVLQSFRKYKGKAALIMSPIGERDIDLPEADLLIIFDCVRTSKTVYQQLKRIRGGKGLFLYYDNSYEAKKVNDVIQTILHRYPWSIKLQDSQIKMKNEKK
jgi:superfamily II DNA or RNA helicase